MARRNDHTRDEIKQMVIDAGQEIVRSEGLAGLGARRLARQINYTVGTLYNVFENFDDIILQINAVTLDDMAIYLKENIDPSLSGRAAIEQMVTCYVTFVEQNPKRWRSIFDHHLYPEQPAPEWFKGKIGALFCMLEAQLAPMMVGSKHDTKTAARALWAAVHGICVLSVTQKMDVIGAGSMNELTDCLLDSYLSGLAHGSAA